MFSKGVSIITLSKYGVDTAIKIKNALSEMEYDCTVFAPAKYVTDGITPMNTKLGDFIKNIFDKVDAIISVMAIGITVRTIAPCLKDKRTDPAVVAVDDLGKFAVSLLSGHLGGSNQLTKLISDGIGASVVVTTASDLLGKKSVEELARELHCKINNFEGLLPVNSAIVNKESVIVVLTEGVSYLLGFIEDFETTVVDDVEMAKEIINAYDAGIIITEENAKGESKKPIVYLNPMKIVVGIGSKKNINKEEITKAITLALDRVNISLNRVNCLATAEIKKGSSIIEAAENLELPIEIIDMHKIKTLKHADLSLPSEIVKRQVGVGGVCEQAALIAAGKRASLLLKKTKFKEGVTIAISRGE
ncbi:MAG: cobalamin biosynthesis protein [Candidatus Methylarchaceae archaeon HK02M2]|nr:cobalamin biosynthesis protein [Candidatus Methylarchaceae archaeon HK02M2]